MQTYLYRWLLIPLNFSSSTSCTAKSLLVPTAKMNDDLHRVSLRLKANKFTVNPSKSFALLIMPPNFNKHLSLINLRMNNSPIFVAHSVKYWGVNIDFNLKFDSYISSIVQRISRAVEIHSKLKTVYACPCSTKNPLRFHSLPIAVWIAGLVNCRFLPVWPSYLKSWYLSKI